MLCKAELSSFIKDVLPILQKFLVGLDTPLSLGLNLLISSGTREDWEQVYAYEFDPSRYLEKDLDLFDRDYQAYSLCRKLPNFLELPLEEKAIEAFQQAEGACALMNTSLLDGSLPYLLRERDLPSLSKLKRVLSRILGKAPSLPRVQALGGWGPGSSVSMSRDKASPEAKCEYGNTCTLKLAQAIENEIRENPDFDPLPWLDFRRLGGTRRYKLVPGNIITTVPKSLKTDRTIAIEPDVNSYYQKGIGTAIRRRLRRWNIDLNDQSFNQRAAMNALAWGFATLDLKAASDSVAWMLVCDVFPDDWVALFEVTRSERYTFQNRRNVHDGLAEWYEYQKVSSMGNGFTFELESVLFFAICLAADCDQGEVFVYGDDLVVPKGKANHVVDLLESLGFIINTEKSFMSGLFYESCGVHTFNGVDVTPIHIKDLHYGTEGTVQLANKFRSWSHRRCNYNGCDRRALPAWRACLHRLGNNQRSLRGPYGTTITLWCNLNETASTYSVRRGGFLFSHLVPRIKKREADFYSRALTFYRIFNVTGGIPETGLLSIRQIRLSICNNMQRGNTVKDVDTGRRRKSVMCVERWYDMGPWR